MKICRRIEFVLPVLITACLICKALSAGPSLSISPAFPILTFPAKNPFALVCQGRSEDSGDRDAFTNMKWVNPRGEIINEGQDGALNVRQIGANGLKLLFGKPRVEDTGYYNCSALYRNTDRLEISAFVSVYEDISWENCELEQSIIVDKEGRISCMPNGDPKPDINWQKDGVYLKSEGRFTITAEGIIISNVRPEDEGEYKVEAFVSDTGIDRYKDIKVTVLVPPEIIKLEDTYHVIEGEEYIIECMATGHPRPVFTWFDPQKRDLSDAPGYNVDKNDGTLTILKAERNSRGLYTCQAENKAGKAERTMDLTVLIKPVIQRFDNVTAREGQVTTLECHVEGDPEPKITIRKDNNLPFEGNADGHVDVQTSIVSGIQIVTLRINKVKRSDDGNYFCSAENDAAHVERAGHIEVHFAPNMSATPTTNVKAWASNPANLTCIAEANPNATIQWRHQNEIIQPTDPRYVIYGGTSYSNLLVKLGEIPSHSDAFDVYTCEARNAIGENSIDIRLEEATPPGPLSQIVFEKVTSTSITFKFMGPSNDGGLPITGFVVKYWKTNGESELQAATDHWGKGSDYVLSNLKPRVEYAIKIAAKNAAGIGAWVQKTYLMPVERVPEIPLFVNEMERESDYSDSYEIRWTIPDDNGEPIRHFEVRYYKVNKDNNGYHPASKAANVKIEKWDNPVYTLSPLAADTWYKVELRANNKLGNSFPGELVFRTRIGESNQGHTSMVDGGVLKPPVIIAIAVVAVLIVLVLLDITCYLRFHCGLLYLMRYHSCGRSASSEKVKDVVVEDGKERVKEVSTANNGKIKTEIKLPSPISPVQGNAIDNCTRPADLIIDENFKNKSPRGSKSSIGKSSPV